MSENTQLAVNQPRASALAVMASQFSVEPQKLLATLKATVFKGASDEELLALVVVANSYKLNPLTKEIYAFPAKGGGIVPVVSVDGWTNMMNSHPQFDGLEHTFEHDDKGGLISCTAIIHRKDRNRPIKVTEYLSECRRNTEPWKMEHRMLRHKALSQCVRVAFGFSGVHDEDEARDITPEVREIQKADMTTRAVTVTAEVVDTAPKRTATRVEKKPVEEAKPEPQQEPAPEKTDVPADKAPAPTGGTLKEALEKSGLSDPLNLCVKMANQFGLTRATTFDEIPADVQVSILADWDTALDAMIKISNATK